MHVILLPTLLPFLLLFPAVTLSPAATMATSTSPATAAAIFALRNDTEASSVCAGLVPQLEAATALRAAQWDEAIFRGRPVDPESRAAMGADAHILGACAWKRGRLANAVAHLRRAAELLADAEDGEPSDQATLMSRLIERARRVRQQRRSLEAAMARGEPLPAGLVGEGGKGGDGGGDGGDGRERGGVFAEGFAGGFVPRRRRPSFEDFYRQHVVARRPAVITGVPVLYRARRRRRGGEGGGEGGGGGRRAAAAAAAVAATEESNAWDIETLARRCGDVGVNLRRHDPVGAKGRWAHLDRVGDDSGRGPMTVQGFLDTFMNPRRRQQSRGRRDGGAKGEEGDEEGDGGGDEGGDERAVEERTTGHEVEDDEAKKTTTIAAAAAAPRTLGVKGRTFIFDDPAVVNDCSAFFHELHIPPYFAQQCNVGPGRALYSPGLFLMPKGAYSGLHVDSGGTHFWQALLQGRKRWTFYPLPSPAAAELLLYLDPMTGASAVDPQHPDFEAFPLFAHAHRMRVEVEVGPGDIVFVPANLPHQVVSLTDTLAVSHNYVDLSNALDFVAEGRTQYLVHEGMDRLEALVLGGAHPEWDPEAVPWSTFRSDGSCGAVKGGG